MMGLGKICGFEKQSNKVCITFEKGTAYLEIIRGNIVNVFLPYETKDHRSKAIEGEKAIYAEFSAAKEKEREKDVIVVKTENLAVKVYDDCYVDFYKADGTPLCADSRKERIPRPALSEKSLAVLKAEGHDVSGGDSWSYPVQTVKVLDGDEKFYGLGDKTGVLNKRDYEYENWNSDIPQAHTDGFKALYKSVPFLITLKSCGVFGLFFDNTNKSCLNLGKENEGYFFYGAAAGNLDYYFIYGDKMPEVVKGYTYLTGTTPLPQLWTLGYQQSRWSYDSAEMIREIAGKYRKLQIPCDAIHFDIDYMDGYRVFTWNEKDFGAPGGIIEEIGRSGFKTVCIVDPGVKREPGYAKYDEGAAKDYFAKTPEGEIYVNEVWPGEAVYPDFGKKEVRSWWADNQKYMLTLGAHGIWNDMNEPASFRGELPDDVVFTDEDRPSPHSAVHNVYGHLMAKATYEGLKKYDGKRPFIITRACYAGTQKYAAVWTGDNQSLWAHLQMAVPQLLNMGLSGLSFAGTDVGGFGADCTPELLCRWVQLGAFSPLFRNHSSNGSIFQEPWRFNQKTLEINRKFICLRYQLLPYFYDLFWQGEKTGLPAIRPLVLHYEEDRNTWNLNDEFLVGEYLLVAPVLTQGAQKRMVYFPEGIWYDFFTGKEYAGEKYCLVDAPIDVCPVFAKAGSMIPTWEVMQYIGERPYDTLRLKVFKGKGVYEHYQDNGTDFAYREGAYNLYQFHQDVSGEITLRMLREGYEAPYRRIEYVREPYSVSGI